ncbi:probable DNA-directed RNA polymerases I and III subunit RPAC2 [Chrysoperla carnea]|uniref:probable DNA-directed RNA polymerases I and III subunit RPAC2 n=1 Tax=Chrysoperla carnea TaxID=189513 RepID=UPI001D08214A|nr:probable DNA-directed RNA polymerases I and III subunit RPAC2 [Chrysoperla carnea]
MSFAELAGDEQSGDKSRTFIFENEGHTFGNILRYIICSYPEVQFCGYTVPHPAESKMHFRIQTYNSRAIDILKRGLEDVQKLCDHTMETIQHEVTQHKQTLPTSLTS